MGAQLLEEVAAKTNDIAGDGTTTSIVLAQAIITEGLKNVTSGASPMGIKRGIEKGVEAIVAEIKNLSKPVETQGRHRPHRRHQRARHRDRRTSSRK